MAAMASASYAGPASWFERSPGWHIMRHACFRAASCECYCPRWLPLLFCTTGLVAQDKPVYIVDTDPAPAQIEGGTFFLVGGLIATMVRNRHTSPVQVTLRAWESYQAGRFKGTNVHCVADWFDRGTRRLVNAPLDVRDLASTDSVAVAIERVIADRREWLMADSADIGVRLARDGSRGQAPAQGCVSTSGAPRVCRRPFVPVTASPPRRPATRNAPIPGWRFHCRATRLRWVFGQLLLQMIMRPIPLAVFASVRRSRRQRPPTIPRSSSWFAMPRRAARRRATSRSATPGGLARRSWPLRWPRPKWTRLSPRSSGARAIRPAAASPRPGAGDRPGRQRHGRARARGGPRRACRRQDGAGRRTQQHRAGHHRRARRARDGGLCDGEYANLFMLALVPGQPPRLVHGLFGAPDLEPDAAGNGDEGSEGMQVLTGVA